MEYKKLPPVQKGKKLPLPHFPTAFHAALFRLWETVSASKLAKVFGTDEENIKKAANDMGLPPQKHTDLWRERGYITTVRNAWHILPYDQLLLALDMAEEEFATVLKDDDFLGIKLGNFKPFCEKVVYTEPNAKEKDALKKIKSIMMSNFGDIFDGKAPFDFFGEETKSYPCEKTDGLCMIYSFCGLYASVLDRDISLSFPETLLESYKNSGVNAVWLPACLYQLTEFPFDKKYSQGYLSRRENLKKLVKTAEKYGIKVFLYLNEPRCMPLEFFDSNPDLLGSHSDFYGALCSSDERVCDYLRSSVRELCSDVPELGGFFLITCSENLTHCKSNKGIVECERCKDVPIYKPVSSIITAVSEESRKINPHIKTVAWTWAWEDFMSDDEIRLCIDAIPKEVIIQTNSEAYKEFCIGGVCGSVRDYSMSIPGPSELAKKIWSYAAKTGHEVAAKVQVNVTWECSTLPYLPVFDLVREHMASLNKIGVRHLMLSWTLGGFPSVNLKIASACLSDPSEEKYDELLLKEFGKDAPIVKKAASVFSDAFREFPFVIQNLYFGPQNAGPSNLLYLEPTGFEATMTCFSYDDIDTWRSIYPRDVYISQLKKLREKWKNGIDVAKDLPDCTFKRMAYAAYAIFSSCYVQAEFIDKRKNGNAEYLISLIKDEEENALLLYDLMQKDAHIGFEAANHYYYNKFMLAEKVLNCRYLCDKLKQ